MANELTISESAIPGLLLIQLPVHGDSRGWFKENWQREKMVSLGMPDFQPVQNNVSFNEKAGTTRGIHAEPWDKLASVVTGKVFGAWVDLREGETFGAVFTAELDPATAMFVPRGVANAFQTLEDNTTYVYLVNDHWRADAEYTFLNLADETVAVPWPISLDQAELSDKDRTHPRLSNVEPMRPLKTLILGANGQLGRALQTIFPKAEAASREEFDLTNPASFTSRNWRDYDTIINAAAYTKVDEAETISGRRQAWLINVSAVAELAKIATRHNITLVHVSSDYVFDGEIEEHTVDEGFSPLGVYGQTKAAGDAVVSTVPKHYIVRTSWVIGDGDNFIRTMYSLAENGVEPKVVNDQFGRLTYTEDLAQGIKKLLDDAEPFGTYNITSDVPVQSWFEIARDVFIKAGRPAEAVRGVSTEEYFKGKSSAPRPHSGTLDIRGA